MYCADNNIHKSSTCFKKDISYWFYYNNQKIYVLFFFSWWIYTFIQVCRRVKEQGDL